MRRHMAAVTGFVMGAGRSGTSILQELLCMHGTLVVSHELRVLELAVLAGALIDKDGETAIDERAPKSTFGLEAGVRFVELLAEEQLRAAGKPHGVYLDKYPPYCEHIAHLDRLWPHAKFVHILRDGRDVAASAVQAYIGDHGWRRASETPTLEALAAYWTKLVRTAREYGARLPKECYLELRYEDLTHEPARELERVLRFVGLAPDANHAAMAAKMRPGKTWRETLSHEELVAFESVADASALNRELGYPPTPLKPSDAGADTTTSSWTAGVSGAVAWAKLGDAARAAGDAKRAEFAYLRAVRGKEKVREAAHALLADAKRPEALFAAMNARTWDEAASREALATWMEARGLDRAASRAALGLGSNAT